MNDSWVSTVKNSINPKVLLMLSGGKDSIAAMTKMIEEGIDVHAIHFVHDWGERIPTEEAERTCDLLGVELIKYNFSKEFHDTVIGYTNGRPCLLCKRTNKMEMPIMELKGILLQFCVEILFTED